MSGSESLPLEALREGFDRAGQGHVFRWMPDLDATGRERLARQLAQVDLNLVRELAAQVREGRFGAAPPSAPRPADYVRLPRTLEEELERESARRAGERRIREGKVAALTVAGGQGTRLGFDGPKGAFPIGPVSQRTLFQIHAERLRAVRRRYRVPLPWYIMTSDATDAPTREFFRSHDLFGLPPEDVRFFQQGLMPALDRSLRLALIAKDSILLSPNGHGGTFAALRDTGMFDDMSRRGIEDISYFQVDNPLVAAVDPVFIGFHCLSASDMSSKTIWKRTPDEPLGAFVRIRDALTVVEYSDLTPDQMQERTEAGDLLYGLGSPAIHILRVDFARRIAEEGGLPWHLAIKSSPWLDDAGRIVPPEGKNVYKFERFLFDALPRAERTLILEMVREREFAPVKNLRGEDSADSCRAAMTALGASWLAAAGVEVPRDSDGRPLHPIEISPLFALDEEELAARLPSNLAVDGPIRLSEERRA